MSAFHFVLKHTDSNTFVSEIPFTESNLNGGFELVRIDYATIFDTYENAVEFLSSVPFEFGGHYFEIIKIYVGTN